MPIACLFKCQPVCQTYVRIQFWSRQMFAQHSRFMFAYVVLTYGKCKEMLAENFTKDKLGSGVRKRQKRRDAIPDPVKHVITDVPAQDEQCQHELYTQTPANRSPVYLCTTKQRFTKHVIIQKQRHGKICWFFMRNRQQKIVFKIW